MKIVFSAMKNNGHPDVSRETFSLNDILERFSADENFMLPFRLLQHRKSLRFNTDNHSCILFFLAMARRKNFLPLILFEKESEAESFFADASAFFNPEGTAWIPLFPNSPALHNPALLENHLSFFLSGLFKQRLDLIISSAEVFEKSVPDDYSLRKYSLHLKAGTEISFPDLQEKLAALGYQRSMVVEFCGEFSIRGGILDIYPYGETYPFRIEFFGDTVDSVRRFNPNDQISFESASECRITPSAASDFARSKVRDILPENTLVIHVADPKSDEVLPDFDAEIDLPQCFFDPRFVEADCKVSLLETVRPEDPHDAEFWQQILDQKAFVVVFSEHKVLRESIYSFLGDKALYVPANLRSGFFYKPANILVLSAREIFRKSHYKNPNQRFIPEHARAVSTVESLQYGDAVVHVDHGVGLYRGIARLEFRGLEQEAMIIEYKNKDKIYVPIPQMNKVFHYGRENGKILQLDQIGSLRWEQAKIKARKYLRESTIDLIALYKDRKELPGFAFEKDTPDMSRLEESFPFEETPDQLQTISDVREDMEKAAIMDRLVCGDVGFGKTEVAIRAAFKAVYSGKQVAVLVPTTLLCFQHYESFLERLDVFGIRVAYMNRFVSGKKLRDMQEKLRSGQIDILIGTHKILSNILLFKDLGFLIVDEEHRFGVQHKEKISSLKRRIDVLTLTATPIPRTLQLALAGLRDISKIESAPRERLPIVTRIMYWDVAELRAAIERELDRNGQIFILNNHISELPALQRMISDMFPAHGVRYAHGQMPGELLEKTMLDFYHHSFDILITTSIIESGIDIPNANTLIVINAHRFGLSQLYQIRGRVGRSYRKAFAYLLIPKGKALSPDAMKRLQTLEYYTELGSGYHIAMRDLEIRGAGDLFGVEQSGHMNRLGYAYFNRMLEDTVREAKNPGLAREESPEIRLQHSAYLPEDYVDSKDIRIGFYHELSRILGEEQKTGSALKKIDELRHACRDRFGPLPETAENLFRDARLSLFLKPYYIESLVERDEQVFLYFKEGVQTNVLQDAAGRLLYIFRENGLALSFISKKQLLARCGLAFISRFNAGTFSFKTDSKPV